MRIALVFYHYTLGTCGTVIETIKSLDANGIEVDAFISEKSYAEAPVTFDSPKVRLFLLPSPELPPSGPLFLTALRKTWLFAASMQHWLAPWLGLWGSLSTYFEAFRAKSSGYMAALEPHFRKNHYDVVIGVDDAGLITACRAVELWQPDVPVIYYNMELPQHEWHKRPGAHITKHMETLSSHRCRFTVIADEGRGMVFSKVNRVPKSKVRFLPITAGGRPVETKSRYLQDRFGIPDDIVVVLYAGTVARPWAMGLEVVQSVPDWPKNCALVIHSWHPSTATDPLFLQMQAEAVPGRVFFSLDPVPAEKLPDLISSADVGLAFYRPIDPNHIEIGSSSNKLAQHARMGLPSITNRLPSIERVIDRFGSGVCVEHPRDIGRALETITKDYERYRACAFQSYRQHYDFAVHFSPIVKEIQELSVSRTPVLSNK